MAELIQGCQSFQVFSFLSFLLFLLKRHLLFFLSVKVAKTNSKDQVVIKKYLFFTALEAGRSKVKVWGIWCLGRTPLLVAVSYLVEREIQFLPFLYCCCYCSVAKSSPSLLWPHGLQPIGSSVPEISKARILGWVVIYFPPGDLPHPRIDPASPALAGGFFTTEPVGKPPKKIYITLKILYC